MALYPVHNERHAVHGIFKRRISEKNILRRKGDSVRKRRGRVTINLISFGRRKISRTKGDCQKNSRFSFFGVI